MHLTLDAEQIRKLADICADIAQVVLATIVIPFFLQVWNWRIGLVGLIITCAAGISAYI